MEESREIIEAQEAHYTFATSELLQGDNFFVIHERWVRKWSVEYVENPLSTCSFNTFYLHCCLLRVFQHVSK